MGMTKHQRRMRQKRAKIMADAYESKQNKRMELTILLSRPKIGLIRKHIVLAEITQRNAKEMERMSPFLRRIEMNQMGRRVMERRNAFSERPKLTTKESSRI